MTRLSDRPNTALLVIDVQNGVVGNAHQRDEVVSNISDVVDKARAANVPVIWVQHSSDNLPMGSEEWQYVDELQQTESESVIHKRYGDSFEDTELESELAARRVGRLVVTGAQTDECVRSTLHGAITRGYDTILVGDAHTTEDLSEWGAPTPDKVISHTNMYWSGHSAPGRTAAVVDTADLSFDS
jgi:nicotinamidase-related amidase